MYSQIGVFSPLSTRGDFHSSKVSTELQSPGQRTDGQNDFDDKNTNEEDEKKPH